jgi:nucleoside-diphosphate-sugar epimerase
MGLALAVTGATGFVGKSLIPQLLMRGHHVSVLVRDPMHSVWPDGVRVVKGDLADAQALAALVRGVDGVIHLAGKVSALTRHEFDLVNVLGIENVARAAVHAGVKRFVNLSSLAAREPDLNDYAASKFAGEEKLQAFAQTVSIIQLRAAAIYGPGDKATLPLLKSLLNTFAVVPGGPHAWFSMIHVNDVARSVADAAETESTGVFELSDGSDGYRWSDVVAVMREHFGQPKRVFFMPKAIAMMLGRGGDVVGRFLGRPAMLNSGQLRQLYHGDWRVKQQHWPVHNSISLRKGLPETVQWYQKSGMLPRAPKADTTQPKQGTD